MVHPIARRWLAAALGAVLSLSFLGSAAVAAPTVNQAGAVNRADTVNRAGAAAGWLARQLVDGDHLARTAAGAPAASVSFLIGTRCADGGYPVFFDGATCESDVDATAMAAQALLAAHRLLEAERALTFLVGVQQADGGFVNSGVANANSTGLAGQALFAGARLVAAAKADAFLRGLQVGCTGAAADRGAIAFSAAGLDPSTAVRATAQGILGLSGVGFHRLSSSDSSSGASTLAC